MNDIETSSNARSGMTLLILFMGIVSTLAGEPRTSTWRIVPPAVHEVGLPQVPPLAVVTSRDDSGKTWRVQGSLGGTRVVAESDFKICFERQGWRLDKAIPIGGDKQRLFLWRRGGHSIILMLHEVGVARTAFAVGLDDDSGQAGQTLARNLPHGLTKAQTNQEPNQKQ